MVDSITLFGGECVLASASHGPSVVLFPLSRSYPTSSGSNSATSFLWEKAIMFSSRKEPFTAYPQTGARYQWGFPAAWAVLPEVGGVLSCLPGGPETLLL